MVTWPALGWVPQCCWGGDVYNRLYSTVVLGQILNHRLLMYSTREFLSILRPASLFQSLRPRKGIIGII